jgi:hypothetical protein
LLLHYQPTKSKWVKAKVTHRPVRLTVDTLDSALMGTEAIMTLRKVVTSQVGGHDHLQGATRHHRLHLHKDPPAATNIDNH